MSNNFIPVVSIIIPLHNGEAFISKTLNSVLCQTYSNIEVVVVENGSNDNSWNILGAIKDERLKKYSISAKTASEARNFGFNQSSGDLICFLDADDILEKNKIEIQVKGLLEHNNQAISCGPWGKFWKNIEEAKFVKQEVWDCYTPIDWLITSWNGGGMMIPGCWLIPKTIIEKSGPWDEVLTLHDDGEFMCRVMLQAKKIVFEDKALVYYRQRDDSLSRQNSSYSAAKSALMVYNSYRKNSIKFENSLRVKEALAKNYAKFIYEFFPDHKDLIVEAFEQLQSLNVKTPMVGGSSFRKLQGLVGFNLALKVKKFIA